MVKKRWTWPQQLFGALVMVLLLFALDIFLRPLGLTTRSIVRAGYAILVAGIIYHALNTLKVRRQKFKQTSFIVTMMIIVSVTLILLFFIMGIPYQISQVFHSPTIISDTLMALSAAIFEEFICRGLLFSVFEELCKNAKLQMTLSAIFSAAAFGLLHFVNLIGGQGVEATLQQATYAFCLGVLFAAVRVATNTLTWVVLIHFLIDWQSGISVSPASSSSPWVGIVVIFGTVLAVATLYLIAMDQNLNRHPLSKRRWQ